MLFRPFYLILSVLIFGGLFCASSAFAQQNELYRRKLLNEQFSTESGLVKIAFLDVDGTLLISGKFGLVILPSVAERIAELNAAGYLVMTVSNQSLEKGDLPIRLADRGLYKITQIIRTKNSQALIHYIDFSDHDPHDKKPNTGMAERIENELALKGLKVDWTKSLMVGDAAYTKDERDPQNRVGQDRGNTDRLFAKKLKIQFYQASDFFGWSCQGVHSFKNPEQVAEYEKNKKIVCANRPQIK